MRNNLKYYTYKLDLKILNILAIILFVIVGGIVFYVEKNDNYIMDIDTLNFIILI